MPEKEIKKRGSAIRWRTIELGEGKYAHVAIVRKKGKEAAGPSSGKSGKRKLMRENMEETEEHERKELNLSPKKLKEEEMEEEEHVEHPWAKKKTIKRIVKDHERKAIA